MRITIPGVGDGQGGLACYSPRGSKESDTTERLNWWGSTALQEARPGAGRAFPAFVPAAEAGSDNHLTLKATEDRKGPPRAPQQGKPVCGPSRGPGRVQASTILPGPTISKPLPQPAMEWCGEEVVGVGRRVSDLACLTQTASKYQPHHRLRVPHLPPNLGGWKMSRLPGPLPC